MITLRRALAHFAKVINSWLVRRSDESRNAQSPLPTLEEARAEFAAPVFVLLEPRGLEFAGVGVLRRDGVLTGVSVSYWKQDSTAPQRIANPSVRFAPEVVRTWTEAEFGEGDASAETMLSMHLDFVSSNTHFAIGRARPPVRRRRRAFLLDGVPIAGVRASGSELFGAAGRVGEFVVSVAMAGPGRPATLDLLTSR
ncbi:hypothetical protein BH09ACT4_BH09ACT4_03630 [soil metagenome]